MDAVVLAGGGSRRLGQDKATVDVGGSRQVDRVVAALRALGGQVVLAGGADPPEVDDTITVDDEPGLAGPLAGIVAGLRTADTPLVAVVAVDVVDPSVRLLRALALEAERTGAAGLVPIVGGRWQHLHSVLRRVVGPGLADADQQSARVALEELGVVGVAEDTWRAWAPEAHPEHDIDTPADLASARRGVAGRRPRAAGGPDA